MKKLSLLFLLVVSIFVLLSLEHPAEAYLDGGTGSMIFQVLVGGIAGMVLAVKLFWHKIVGLVTGKKSTDQSGNQSEH